MHSIASGFSDPRMNKLMNELMNEWINKWIKAGVKELMDEDESLDDSVKTSSGRLMVKVPLWFLETAFMIISNRIIKKPGESLNLKNWASQGLKTVVG